MGHTGRASDPKLVGFRPINWRHDPFAYGSYSHMPKGGRHHHRHLSKSFANKVFFAGTATNPHRNLSDHAALERGRSVASQILSQTHQKISIIGGGNAGLSAVHLQSVAGRDAAILYLDISAEAMPQPDITSWFVNARNSLAEAVSSAISRGYKWKIFRLFGQSRNGSPDFGFD